MATHNLPAVEERTTPRITATVRDSAGNPIPQDDLDSLTLTLTDQRTRTVINDRLEFDILSFVNSSGVLTFDFEQDDMILVGENEPGAQRVLVALIIGEYDSDKRFMDRILIPVHNEIEVA
jgi:hypothetical protein